jgi:hypothetical protein
VKDTARTTGRSKRSIETDVSRAKALGADLDRVMGTSLNSALPGARLTADIQISFLTPQMPTRTEQLADLYLKTTGIAAVYVEPDGAIGIANVVTVDQPAGRLVLCCARGKNLHLARLVNRCAKTKDMPAVDRLQAIARANGVGLTPHLTVVERAYAAVNAVNVAVEHMQGNGGLREFNAGFKAARKADSTLRYFDYLHAKKASMLQAMARETNP